MGLLCLVGGWSCQSLIGNSDIVRHYPVSSTILQVQVSALDPQGFLQQQELNVTCPVALRTRGLFGAPVASQVLWVLARGQCIWGKAEALETLDR